MPTKIDNPIFAKTEMGKNRNIIRMAATIAAVYLVAIRCFVLHDEHLPSPLMGNTFDIFAPQ